MKSSGRMLFAFLLNLGFALFEFVGGALTGSIAIASDALHDLGDAMGIGIACALEHRSCRPADKSHTFGYGRLSVVGSVLTTGILIFGSGIVIFQSVNRIIHPVPIDYRGMIGFAVVGVAVNLVAAVLTHRGESLNQKAINLHMLEDVLGWLVVLIGAVVMGFSRFSLLDSLLSVGVALFILVHALKTGKEALDVLLEKAPMDVHRVEQALEEIPQVEAVEHLHLWTLDGIHHLATVHLITAADPASVRTQARQVLSGLGIGHATLEVAGPEDRGQSCPIPSCTHHHHHHHHH